MIAVELLIVDNKVTTLHLDNCPSVASEAVKTFLGSLCDMKDVKLMMLSGG